MRVRAYTSGGAAKAREKSAAKKSADPVDAPGGPKVIWARNQRRTAHTNRRRKTDPKGVDTRKTPKQTYSRNTERNTGEHTKGR
ncbi:hypothetical protein GCM10023405_17400 [Streptomonospora salina]